MAYKPNRFAWIDIETTGLDPAEALILEVALVITDGNLVEIARVNYVRHWPSTPESRKLAGINEAVEAMHTESGLWKECNEGGLTMPPLSGLLHFLLQHYCHGEKPVLAGSSPHFDRNFIRLHMPGVHRALNYRHFDATTLRTAYEIACEGTQRAPDTFETKAVAHRAMPDILHSLSTARKCIELMKNGVVYTP